MKGAYCLLARLHDETRIVVGALGVQRFPPGIYAYVGSGLGGIEQRIGRHKRAAKKLHWHIDYFLQKAEIFSVIVVSSESKKVECEIARSLSESENAIMPVHGFGSSDCRCVSHLIFFGDIDPEMVAETAAMQLTMLQSVYPRSKTR